MENKKFMQSVSDTIYSQLEKEADRRGTNVQELLRNVVIPEWMRENSRK